MYDLSRVVDVPIAFFFDDMSNDVSTMSPGQLSRIDEFTEVASDPDPMAKRETLELVRAYYRIADPIVRRRIFDLTKSVAAGFDETEAA